MRKTLKYRRACGVLGIDPDAEVPHEGLYGMLAMKGYQWTGKNWVRAEKTRRTKAGEIRIMASEPLATDLAGALVDFLEINGAHIVGTSGPYPNKADSRVRRFIKFTI